MKDLDPYKAGGLYEVLLSVLKECTETPGRPLEMFEIPLEEDVVPKERKRTNVLAISKEENL